jgi:predicted nucleic acid-binding protein
MGSDGQGGQGTVKVYLDVSCLNRPFDDQSQVRIRLESEAVTLILNRFQQGEWQHVSAQIAKIEIDAMPDADRRRQVQLLLPAKSAILAHMPEIFRRAEALEKVGFKPADALHVAAAEAHAADMLLSCDDRLCRLARRRRHQLTVLVKNPLDWLKEIGHAPNR